jgi:ribonuclease P protein component
LSSKGCHEGEADVPAEHAPAEENAWIPRAHEHEERPTGSEAPEGEGAQTTDRQQRVAAFGRHERIRRRAEFQEVYARGVRIRGRFGTLYTLPRTGATGRLGIAATKKLGGATIRNRAKRLIREVFRRNKIASGFDVVIVPKRELLDASLTDLETEYRRNFARSLQYHRAPR